MECLKKMDFGLYHVEEFYLFSIINYINNLSFYCFKKRRIKLEFFFLFPINHQNLYFNHNVIELNIISINNLFNYTFNYYFIKICFN